MMFFFFFFFFLFSPEIMIWHSMQIFSSGKNNKNIQISYGCLLKILPSMLSVNSHKTQVYAFSSSVFIYLFIYLFINLFTYLFIHSFYYLRIYEYFVLHFFQVDVRSTYQRVFDSRGDYDCKMHRDDRTSVHRIGCAVHEEVLEGEWIFLQGK